MTDLIVSSNASSVISLSLNAAVIEASFCTGLAHRVIAMCNPENEASERLMQRLGMRKEGQLVKNLYFRTDENGHPIWQDTAMYAVLDEEWKRA